MKAAHFIFLSLLLALAALAWPGPTAAAENNGEFVTQMDDNNVALFLEEMKAVSMGRREDMMPEEIETYLKRHLAPKSSFHSKTTFKIPGYPEQDAEMKLNRDEYIAKILEGQGLISGYETEIEIKKMKLENSGRTALVSTVSTEHGTLPWPDENAEQKPVPIRGRSECEQRLIVSFDNYIQMASAKCTTVISFLPFGDKPLGE